MGTVEGAFLHFIQTVYQSIGWPGVIALMTIESAFIPIPSEIIMPFAGWFLVKSQGLGIGWVFFLALFGALGNLLGALFLYWIGWIGARPVVERWGKYALITRNDLDSAQHWFDKHGEITVLLSRLFPVARTFLSLPAGMAHMHPLKFSLLTFLGSYPFALGLAYGGYLLGEHWNEVNNLLKPVEAPIIVIAVLLVMIFLWRRYRAAWGREVER